MDALHLSVKEKAPYWKARAKVRFVLEGDENTKFFHASATCRLHHNSIPSLVVDGTRFYDHPSKVIVLKDFFADLVGTVSPDAWPFDVSSLYLDAPALGRAFSFPSARRKLRRLSSL
jgi:hypothetical protein